MRMTQCRYCKNYFEGYGVGDYCSNDCIKKEVNEEFARKAQLDAAYEAERQTELLEQQIYEQKLEKLSNKFYSRECPQCAELVKRKAKICKECRFEFSDHKEQIEYLQSWESRASKFGLHPWEKEAIEHEEWKISPEGQKVLEEQKRKIEEQTRKKKKEKNKKKEEREKQEAEEANAKELKSLEKKHFENKSFFVVGGLLLILGGLMGEKSAFLWGSIFCIGFGIAALNTHNKIQNIKRIISK